MEKIFYDELSEKLKDKIRKNISKEEFNAFTTEFKRTTNLYDQRISQLGVKEHEICLDAGCGFGNWAFRLSKVFHTVEAIDTNSTRLLVADLIKNDLENKNINFSFANIESTDYENEKFDFIFCYSVIMFSNIDKSLMEFYRILKPNGKLFVMSDLWTWYFRYLFNLCKKNQYPQLLVFLFKKIIYGKPILLSENRFSRKIKKAGFRIISKGNEGETSFNRELQGRFFGLYHEKGSKSKLIEICAEKIEVK